MEVWKGTSSTWSFAIPEFLTPNPKKRSILDHFGFGVDISRIKRIQVEMGTCGCPSCWMIGWSELMHPAFSTSRLLIQRVFGGFHSHGDTPIAGWFIRDHPIEIDDLGVPLFQETPTYEWTSCQHDFFKAVAKTPFEASNSWQSWLGGISWSTMWRFPKIGDPQVPMAFNTKMIYFFFGWFGD